MNFSKLIVLELNLDYRTFALFYAALMEINASQQVGEITIAKALS